MCCHDSALADLHIVGDLNQVVEFCASLDHGSAHGGAVDGCVSADFHIVLKYDDSHLSNLLISSVALRSKAKAITADHGTALHNATVADTAAVVDFHTRIQNHIIAQGHAVAHIHLRVDFDMLADGHAVADVGKRAHIHVIGQGSALSHMDGLLHASLFGALAIDKIKQISKRLVGVINPDQCGFYLMFGFEITTYENRRRLGSINIVGVFRVGQKGQTTCSGLFNLCVVVDHGCGITIDRTINHRCKLLCSNFHDAVIIE